MNKKVFAGAIREGIDQDFLDAADSFAKKLSGVSSSQIRRIFGRIKTLEQKYLTRREFDNFNAEELLLLQPLLAYSAVRAKDENFKSLENVISEGIKAVDKTTDKTQKFERFRRFCKAVEAILAYHKVYSKN